MGAVRIVGKTFNARNMGVSLKRHRALPHLRNIIGRTLQYSPNTFRKIADYAEIKNLYPGRQRWMPPPRNHFPGDFAENDVGWEEVRFGVWDRRKHIATQTHILK